MPDRPAVLLVGNFFVSASGGRGVCEDLALRLSGAGWPVLTTSWKSSRARRLVDMVATSWRRRHAYAVAHVDVFSGLGFAWAETVCWTLRLAGKPYALTLRGGNLPAFAARWPMRVRRLLASAAVVTTPSRYLMEGMRAYRQDLRLLPNPIGLEQYPFRLRDRPAPRLLWLRAFHEIYNPSLAPEVLAALVAEFPDAHLTMVGPDKRDGSWTRTRNVAAARGLTARITMPGGVQKSAVPGWLARGDIFLCTSNIDNTPVSVLEAMACGLCVVSTNVGGIPFLLEHEQDALLVPPDAPEAMAAAVRRILTEPGLAARLSVNARRKAAQSDWSVVLTQWEQLLHATQQGTRERPSC
jgi:glycosyltransferase involved in cell wall biosynthesis